MHNDVKLSQIYYPIINTSDDVTKYIVDAKVTYIITDNKVGKTNNGHIRIILRSITSSKATIELHIPNSYAIYMEIPVVNISEVVTPPVTDSYILITKDLGTLTDLEYDIHPDCLTVMQEAPVLSIGVRYGVISMDKASVEYKYTFKDTIVLNSGNNVTVSGTPEIIIIDAGVGLGNGLFKQDPLLDGTSTNTPLIAKGLRSITGNAGAVSIRSNSPYINIETRHMSNSELSRYQVKDMDISIGVVVEITVSDNGELLV